MNKTSAAFIFSSAMLLTAFSSYAQGFGTVPDEQVPDLTAAFTVDGKSDSAEKKVDKQNAKAVEADQSAFLAKNGASVTVSNSTFNKSGGDTSNEGQSNFYGLNGGIVAQGNASVTLKGVTVNTDAEGANAIFATGEKTKITAKDITIVTKKNSSRGLDATYGASISAQKVSVSTEGAHCAAFATDRGEGTVSVSNGKATTKGEGSPVIYSTGNISVENLTGSAATSEIAVIEGKNSISIKNSKLSGSGSQGIMLYQSMSGDANIGTSTFSVSSSTLTSSSKGPFLYVTNTQAIANFTNTRLTFPSGILVQVSGNNSERGWGTKGANGGTLTLNASKQTLAGKVICDEISLLNLNLGEKSQLTGEINTSKTGIVNLNLNKSAKLTLTADSYVNTFADGNEKFTNIKSNGYTLYYNKNASANSYLGAKTFALKDGGRLCAYDGMSDAEIAEKQKVESVEKKAEPMPKMEIAKFTGTINATGSGDTLKVLLVTEDKTSYLLEELKGPEGKGPEGMGNPPKGNPPQGNPPKGNPPDGIGKGEKPPKAEGRPKPISLQELAEYNGKKVTLEGIAKGSNTIEVFGLVKE